VARGKKLGNRPRSTLVDVPQAVLNLRLAPHLHAGPRAAPLVGKLLGRRRHHTTADYAHLGDENLVETGEKVGALINRAMGGAHGIAN